MSDPVDNDTQPSSESSEVPQQVECPAEREPIVKLWIIAAMLIGFGIWCIVDAGKPKYDYVPLAEDLNGFFSWALTHIGQFVFTIVGAAVAGTAIRHSRRVLVADQEGIGWRGGRKLPWEKVTKLDASRLKDKQILVLEHPDGRLTLDNYKLQNFRDLVAVVEEKVPDEKRTV